MLPLVMAAVGVGTALAVALYKYESAIHRRLRDLHSIRMVRVENEAGKVDEEGGQARRVQVHPKVNLAALDPDFVKRHSNFKMTSLGDYMSSLRPDFAKEQKLEERLEQEIQAAMTAALLKSLGLHLGSAVLPVTGLLERGVHRMAGAFAASLENHESADDNYQGGGLPVSLPAVVYASFLNYERLRSEPSQLSAAATPTALDQLERGEVGFKPSFSETFLDKSGQPLIPNPFVISKHWDEAITGMEQKLMSEENCEWKSTKTETKEGTPPAPPHVYEADSKAMGQNVPVDERLLPGLHTGWGSAQCSHTQHQVLENRVLSVLLNRLAHNYSKICRNAEPLFEVCMDDNTGNNKRMTKPSELIHALVDAGHSVEACVRPHVTTFGISLSVKESDDKWTSIPLALFMENGYVDANGREALSCIPHSGLNLEIRGPLMKKGSVQHFIAIDGLCGWHSNHNADVPWINDVDCGEPVHGIIAADYVRVAALQAVAMNAVATKYSLPHGGYGLTGVCNDSAAMIEYAMTRKTHVYPITLSGRFTMHNLRLTQSIKTALKEKPSMEKEVDALDRLTEAMTELKSDVSSLPSEAMDQCRRQLHCQPPEMPFVHNKETQSILQSIQREVESWMATN